MNMMKLKNKSKVECFVPDQWKKDLIEINNKQGIKVAELLRRSIERVLNEYGYNYGK